MRLYEVGEYEQALDEFKAAHVAKPDPAFLYNVAQCLRQLRQPDRALVMYRRYLAASPHAENRADALKRIAEIEAELAREKPTADEDAGVPPGQDGIAPVNVPPSQPETTTSGAMAEMSATPALPVAKAAPSPWSLGPLRWVAAGVTVALTGGAVAAGMSTSSRYDELRSSCGRTPDGCDDQAIGGVKTRALLTNIFLVAAGISAIGTGVLFYLTPQDVGAKLAWRF